MKSLLLILSLLSFATANEQVNDEVLEVKNDEKIQETPEDKIVAGTHRDYRSTGMIQAGKVKVQSDAPYIIFLDRPVMLGALSFEIRRKRTLHHNRRAGKVRILVDGIDITDSSTAEQFLSFTLDTRTRWRQRILYPGVLATSTIEIVNEVGVPIYLRNIQAVRRLGRGIGGVGRGCNPHPCRPGRRYPGPVLGADIVSQLYYVEGILQGLSFDLSPAEYGENVQPVEILARDVADYVSINGGASQGSRQRILNFLTLAAKKQAFFEELRQRVILRETVNQYLLALEQIKRAVR